MTTIPIATLRAVLDTATDLSASLSGQERFRRLLAVAHRLIPFDAATILKLQGESLRPMAAVGLLPEALGRRFQVADHPRLKAILASRRVMVFPPHSDLPDPFDGLVQGAGERLAVHSCMGAALKVHGQTWGAITFDALEPGKFDALDPIIAEAFVALAAAASSTADFIERLERREAHTHELLQDLSQESDQRYELIGDSPIMQALKTEIDLLAKSGFVALITGETGTGKELVAHQLHRRSDRARAPMIEVNCAALPQQLAESELFGHIRGAFSGAERDRPGKFSLADGGTLFLDEVGEMSLETQAKLLRVLQSGEIQRVGEDQTHQVDVRVIAATNRDLGAEVEAGRFRADLFQRLNVYPIKVPPLRQRTEDIEPLAGFFLEQLARQLGKPQLTLAGPALQVLQHHDWPGNVRELQHVLSRAALKVDISAGERSVVIGAQELGLDAGDHLASVSGAEAAAADTSMTQAEQSLSELTRAFQSQVVADAMRACNGNQAAAARRLGMDRSNFLRLRKRLGQS